MSIDNSAAAFPPTPYMLGVNGMAMGPQQAFAHGMSLRDYFAAKALIPLVAAFMAPESAWDSYEDLASSAYHMADAMLAQRSKK